MNILEWEFGIINYSDGWQQIVFESLFYSIATYEEIITGNYHKTFTLCSN